MRISNISFYCYNNSNKEMPPKINSKYGGIGLCFRGKDLLNLPENEILDLIQKSKSSKNHVGHGFEADVYRIEGTNYCVRIPYISENYYADRFSKELSPVDKVNHIKAKLGFGVTIMPFFEGITLKSYENNPQERYKLQEKISEMPVKSYSELLHQIANAIDNEMVFDCSGGNLIVDTNKQKLTAIDFYSITDNPYNIKPLSQIYSVLTGYGAEQKTSKKIFDKIVLAGLEEFKENVLPCMDLALFDFDSLVLKRQNTNISDKNKKLQPTNSFTVFAKKMNIITGVLNDLIQIKKAEIRDKSLNMTLNYKIREFRRLMQRIH